MVKPKSLNPLVGKICMPAPPWRFTCLRNEGEYYV
jgi:hypothetical protein